MLEDINNPGDIKKLDIDQLQLLADEIKEFLIANIKKNRWSSWFEFGNY